MTNGRYTYFTETPWVVVWYPRTDDEVDADGGNAHVFFICAICGDKARYDFIIPKEQGEHPDGVRFRKQYQLEHCHPKRSQLDPMTAWEMPLLNPEALKGGVEIQGLADRLWRELNK